MFLSENRRVTEDKVNNTKPGSLKIGVIYNIYFD